MTPEDIRETFEALGPVVEFHVSEVPGWPAADTPLMAAVAAAAGRALLRSSCCCLSILFANAIQSFFHPWQQQARRFCC
jgi:hypothetical protein